MPCFDRPGFVSLAMSLRRPESTSSASFVAFEETRDEGGAGVVCLPVGAAVMVESVTGRAEVVVVVGSFEGRASGDNGVTAAAGSAVRSTIVEDDGRVGGKLLNEC